MSLSTAQATVKDKFMLQAEVASLQKMNMNLAHGKNVLEARVRKYTHISYYASCAHAHDTWVCVALIVYELPCVFFLNSQWWWIGSELLASDAQWVVVCVGVVHVVILSRQK